MNKLYEQADGREIGPDDIVLTRVDAYDESHSLSEVENITLQSTKDVSPYNNIYAVYGVLYELYFHDLLDRTSDNEEYETSVPLYSVFSHKRVLPTLREDTNPLLRSPEDVYMRYRVCATYVVSDLTCPGHPSFYINCIKEIVSGVLAGISSRLFVTARHYSSIFNHAD